MSPCCNRSLLLVALDVDGYKYSDMTLACGSLLSAIDPQKISASHISPSSRVTSKDAEEYAGQILNAICDDPPQSIDIAFGVYIWNDSIVKKIIAYLRKRGITSRIILGGPQITFTPIGKLESYYPGADVFIRGEGEEALARVLESSEPIKMNGVHYKGAPDDGSVAMPELEKLPSPFLTELHPIPFERVGKVRWETKRGCPYQCAFCQYGGKSSVRFFSAERIFPELDLFLSKRTQLLTIIDPIFHIGPKYMDIIKYLRQKKYAGKLSVQCHFMSIEEDFIREISELDVTLEFGLQTIHERESAAINRKIDIERVIQIIQTLQKYSIHFEVDLMYGLPLQTVESFKRSIDFCKQHKVPVVRPWPLTLLRGTRLDAERTKYRLQENTDVIPKVVASSTFNIDEWMEMKRIADTVRT